jgi:hypothetical protein
MSGAIPQFSLYVFMAKINNEWSHTSILPVCFYGVDRDNFALFAIHVWLYNEYKEIIIIGLL